MQILNRARWDQSLQEQRLYATSVCLETANSKLKTLIVMNANWKKSISVTIALVVLGVAALYGGPKLLALVIPAAVLLWYGTGPILGSGRN
jgi:hypothetical protein